MIGAKRQVAPWLAVVWGLLILGGAGRSQAEVVNFKQLIPFVNLKMSGWEAEGKPSGTTVKHGDASMSQAQASYRSGDKTLEITVLDLMGNPIPFLGTAMQMEMETGEETIRTTTIQGFRAVETFRVQQHQGELNIAVADRFWVKLEGNGIDSLETLRTAAQQLGLAKLAELAK